MATEEYLAGLYDALVVMEGILHNVKAMVEAEREESGWNKPAWQPIQHAAQRVAMQAGKLSAAIEGIRLSREAR